MEYTIRAVETWYQGHLFRSRLEATWAAFFDLCGWQWEYEPFTLNGWLPDFALIGKEKTILVEVKPVFSFPREVAEKIESVTSSEGVLKAIFGCGIHDYSGNEFCCQAGYVLSSPDCTDSWGECRYPWEPLGLAPIFSWSEGADRLMERGRETERIGLYGFNCGEYDFLSGEWVIPKADKYTHSISLDTGKALWGRAKELTRYKHKGAEVYAH